MKFRTLTILAVAATLTVGSCTKRPIQPQFSVITADTLIDGNSFTCKIEYRFASIGNAQASPALAAIEQANIGRFFEL